LGIGLGAHQSGVASADYRRNLGVPLGRFQPIDEAVASLPANYQTKGSPATYLERAKSTAYCVWIKGQLSCLTDVR
jgi:hypothetical protein